jgi:hypothetical protein
MAFLAFGLLVLTLELEVGLGMVKLLLVELSGTRVAAFVVGMATTAARRRQSPMKPGLVADIRPYVFVAACAQAILSLAVELDMALLAIILNLCVALDERARRHDGLNALRHRCRCSAPQTHGHPAHDECPAKCMEG